MSEAQLRLATMMSVALLGMSALLYFWEPEDKPKDEDATADVIDVAADDVTRVTVRNRHGEVVLARGEGDRWTVEAPYQAPADEWKVRDLVGAIAGLDKGIPLSGDAAGYGLGDPPEASVTLATAKGEQVLSIGKLAPVGRKTYVKTASGALAAVDGDLVARVDIEPGEFRDHKVVEFVVADVAEVTIAGEHTLRVYENDAGWWIDGFTRANPDRVEDLLLGLLDLRFDRFVDVVATGGVTDAHTTVTIIEKDGDRRVIRVGDNFPDGTMVAVDGASTGMVRTDALKLLGQGPTDVGDEYAFPLDAVRATKIAVRLGDDRFTLEKAAGGWTRDGQPEPKAQAAIEALRAASIHYRLEPAPELTQDFGAIAVHTGEELRVIDVGQVVDRFHVVRDRSGGSPYLVPVEQIDKIAKALD